MSGAVKRASSGAESPKKCSNTKGRRVPDKWGVIEVSPPDSAWEVYGPVPEDLAIADPEFFFFVELSNSEKLPTVWRIKVADLSPLMRGMLRASFSVETYNDGAIDETHALRHWIRVSLGLIATTNEDEELALEDGRCLDIRGCYGKISPVEHESWQMNGWVMLFQPDVAD